jgi:sugar/nucleoside kinase (ribokinase family)
MSRTKKPAFSAGLVFLFFGWCRLSFCGRFSFGCRSCFALGRCCRLFNPLFDECRDRYEDFFGGDFELGRCRERDLARRDVVADFDELPEIDFKRVRHLCGRDLDRDFVHRLDEHMASLLGRRLADEVKGHIDLHLLTLFDDIKIRVEDLARDRVDLHIVDESILIFACAGERDERGLARIAPEHFELTRVYRDRCRILLRTVEDGRYTAGAAQHFRRLLGIAGLYFKRYCHGRENTLKISKSKGQIAKIYRPTCDKLLSMKYDFVALGDITTDAFIQLTDAEELNNHGVEELCVRFGDKVAYDDVTEILAVGNAANAAVSAHRVGLSSAFITWTGDDDNGARCREQLKKQGVSDEFLTVEKGKKTNYHYVLMHGAERTILIKHESYAYKMPALIEAPRYLYFSSISESARDFHHEVAAYIAAHPETKLVFQPGTFQIKLGAEALKDVYAVTEIFFCNKEEAQTILGTTEGDVKKLMEGIRALGPKIVAVTDGPQGANILDSSGAWHIPMYPDPAPPKSRTGAGDATASTTTAYIAMGLEPREALMRGVINAASVVQGVGAQTKLLSAAEIEEWYAKRPADFVATAL